MYIYLSKTQMEEAVNEEEAIAYVGLKIMFDKMLTQKKIGRASCRERV